MASTTLNITGMHCGSCAILIDESLEELEGVQRSITDVRAGRTIVEHADAVNVTELLAAVAEAGYTATLA